MKSTTRYERGNMPKDKVRVLYVSHPNSGRGSCHLDPTQRRTDEQLGQFVQSIERQPYVTRAAVDHAFGETTIGIDLSTHRTLIESDWKRLIELVDPVYETSCFVNLHVERNIDDTLKGVKVEFRPNDRNMLPTLTMDVEGVCRHRTIEGINTFSVIPPFKADDFDGTETAKKLAARIAKRNKIFVTNYQLIGQDLDKGLFPSNDGTPQ